MFSSWNTLLGHSKESVTVFQTLHGSWGGDQGKVSPAQTPWLGTQRIVMQMVQSFSRNQELFKEVQEEGTNGCWKQNIEIKLSSVTAFCLCEPHSFPTSEITLTHAVPGLWGKKPAGQALCPRHKEQGEKPGWVWRGELLVTSAQCWFPTSAIYPRVQL